MNTLPVSNQAVPLTADGKIDWTPQPDLSTPQKALECFLKSYQLGGLVTRVEYRPNKTNEVLYPGGTMFNQQEGYTLFVKDYASKGWVDSLLTQHQTSVQPIGQLRPETIRVEVESSQHPFVPFWMASPVVKTHA